MKRQDAMLIALVGFIAVIISIVISGIFFNNPKKSIVKLPVVTPISSQFPLPQTDSKYKAFFNSNALDPTQLIQIGGNGNSTPFNQSPGQ